MAGSATSLIATQSMSAPDSCAARKAARPMRPNPLMATRTRMSPPIGLGTLSVQPDASGRIGSRPRSACGFSAT